MLRAGLIAGDLALPHQAVVEFVAAVTRARPDLGNRPLVRGVSAYQLSWFDAHLWAYAEVHRIPEILSEDFEHGRHYGRVRVTGPFLAATDHVNELPPLYAT